MVRASACPRSGSPTENLPPLTGALETQCTVRATQRGLLSVRHPAYAVLPWISVIFLLLARRSVGGALHESPGGSGHALPRESQQRSGWQRRLQAILQTGRNPNHLSAGSHSVTKSYAPASSPSGHNRTRKWPDLKHLRACLLSLSRDVHQVSSIWALRRS